MGLKNSFSFLKHPPKKHSPTLQNSIKISFRHVKVLKIMDKKRRAYARLQSDLSTSIKLFQSKADQDRSRMH